MSKIAKPIPDAYHSVTPYLIVKDAIKALEFYKTAFGAEEFFRLDMPGGLIGHAEIQIGDSRVMLADEFPETQTLGPQSLGGSSVTLMLYVNDVDAFAKKAVAAGLKIKRPITDQFYGDRSGTFEDPFGHVWSIATHIEDVSLEEMTKRMKDLFKKNE